MVLQFFAHHGVEIKVLSLPTREANKDFELVYEIARELEEFGINRSVITFEPAIPRQSAFYYTSYSQLQDPSAYSTLCSTATSLPEHVSSVDNYGDQISASASLVRQSIIISHLAHLCSGVRSPLLPLVVASA